MNQQKQPTQARLFEANTQSDVNGSAVNAKLSPDKSGRSRWQYRFWLNALNPADFALGQALEALKAARKMESTVKQALQLFLELQRGETVLLRQLFPGVVQSIEAKSAANSEFEQLIERAATRAIRQELAANATPTVATAAINTPLPATPAPVTGDYGSEIATGATEFTFEMDDFELELTPASAPSSSDTSAIHNLIAGLNALKGGA